MNGPQNGLMGEAFGIDLPQTGVEEQDLTLERSMAKYSKTEDFKRIKEHLESRIAFYQGHLPDGTSVMVSMPSIAQWQAANVIIGELKAILASYELATEVVEKSVQR